jgi:hypothetical protein
LSKHVLQLEPQLYITPQEIINEYDDQSVIAGTEIDPK